MSKKKKPISIENAVCKELCKAVVHIDAKTLGGNNKTRAKFWCRKCENSVWSKKNICPCCGIITVKERNK
ncbi:MAG: hypothetical protein OXC46_03045 [Thaumarchaeota archaeon]|nr:hypothetical protein [Nitrososphaerota archaeon]